MKNTNREFKQTVFTIQIRKPKECPRTCLPAPVVTSLLKREHFSIRTEFPQVDVEKGPGLHSGLGLTQVSWAGVIKTYEWVG